MAPTSYTQQGRLCSIDTPLGKDVLLLREMTASEGISRLFSCQLEMVSEDDSVDFAALVGQNVTVELQLTDESTRYFNGFVSRFAQGGADKRFVHYRAEIVPWLWFLTKTTDCRIFQEKSVPEIIEKIFSDQGFSDYEVNLSGTYTPREYCVQYRETDFNFVSRLMEEEGIFYFFKHDNGSHTLMLSDTSSEAEPCPGCETARYMPAETAATGTDLVTTWLVERVLHSGQCALTDYNFKDPRTDLLAKTSTTDVVGGNDRFELFDYPGHYLQISNGDSRVDLRMQEEESDAIMVTASGTCRGFAPGYQFELEEHYRDDRNSKYLLVEVVHTVSQGAAYESGGTGESRYDNAFVCVPHEVPFRQRRTTPKPLIHGSQTATVVGPPGEEIHVDEHGRVKLMFHWDREARAESRNEKSSCWVRVSQNWAGKNWGGVFLPRIGQEVIVSFLEGDPDRPIVTGRVYNGEQTPPYALPANKTQSGVKSRSSKNGSPDNFNEIRFEDKKGSEEVYIHAEKDENIVVENDKTESVGHDETITIGNDRTETVQANETLTVVKDRTRNVNKNETVTVSLMRTHTVGINEMINVGAAQEVTVGGFRALTVGLHQETTIGTNHSENVGTDHTVDVGGDRTTSIGKNDTLRIKKNLVIEAGDQVTIKTGKASIVMKKDGTIQIAGKDITIKGSGKLDVKVSKNITMKGQKILEN